MSDRIRYYVVKNGNAFWAPGAQAEAFSFPKSQPLGPAGEAAMQAAISWNVKWDKRHDKPKPSYKLGSLSHFYDVFRTKDAWTQLGLRTHEDYERCWPLIEKRFGATLVTQITPDMSEAFHVDIHPAHKANPKRDPKGALKLSPNEAHRTLKTWRSLLNAAVSYRVITQAPIGRVSNPSPKGRSGLWNDDEVLVLAFTAAVHGYRGMAGAIRTAWDAMLSPVDVRELTPEKWRAGLTKTQIRTERGKTGKQVSHAITSDTAAIVEAYLETMPQMLPTAPIFRQPNGRKYSKDTFGDHFRIVRALAFPGDERQFLDLRRSAMTEARIGGATREDLGKAAANTVDRNADLEATYLLSASERVLEARTAGRAKLKQGNG